MKATTISYQFLLIGAIMIGLAVILGAFGAHALKEVLSERYLTAFETGVKYQMYHGLAFLTLSNVTIINSNHLKRVKLLLLTGVLLFSGSLYALVTLQILSIKLKFISILTPIGGLFIVFGWSVVVFSMIIQSKNKA